MSPGAEQILQAALALPEPERLELVDALVASCNAAEGRPFDDSWLGVVQRRSAEIDAGKVKAIPWSEVKDRVRRGEGRRG